MIGKDVIIINPNSLFNKLKGIVLKATNEPNKFVIQLDAGYTAPFIITEFREIGVPKPGDGDGC